MQRDDLRLLCFRQRSFECAGSASPTGGLMAVIVNAPDDAERQQPLLDGRKPLGASTLRLAASLASWGRSRRAIEDS
jgi:hypothetical protein